MSHQKNILITLIGALIMHGCESSKKTTTIENNGTASGSGSTETYSNSQLSNYE